MTPTSLKRSHERDCGVSARGRQYAVSIYPHSCLVCDK